MPDRKQAIAKIIEAFQSEPGDHTTETVAAVLSGAATMRSMRGKLAGRDAVAGALVGPDFRRFFSGGTWLEPEEKDGAIALASRLPITMPSGGGRLTLTFDTQGMVEHV
jgi:hypothetical protein